jgi:hypothetical protein
LAIELAPACVCALGDAGAHDRIRTGDLILTKDVLYRLSYVGLVSSPVSMERETGFEPAALSLEG